MRVVFLLLLAAGAVLIIYGSSASTAVASSFSQLFSTGSMDRATWLFLGGGVIFAIGLVGLVLRTRTFAREK